VQPPGELAELARPPGRVLCARPPRRHQGTRPDAEREREAWLAEAL